MGKIPIQMTPDLYCVTQISPLFSTGNRRYKLFAYVIIQVKFPTQENSLFW